MIDAEKRLSDLIDLAQAGEHVLITRNGRPVVELRPVPTDGGALAKGPVSSADIEWMRARAIPRLRSDGPSGPELIGTIRDEDG